MISRRLTISLWVFALIVSVALSAANLYLGDLNQDEGWYLYAARLVRTGKLPYIDFASTQGPVMPFVYTLAVPLIERWGVAGGRLFTTLLGLACALCAAWLAARLVPRDKRNEAALITFTLIGVNVYQSYFCTIVKTYSLSGLLLVLGFLALSCARVNGRRGDNCDSIPPGRAPADGSAGSVAGPFLSGILLSLAAGTRTSAGTVLPFVLAGLAVFGLKNRERQTRNAGTVTSSLPWLWFGFGAAVTCCVIFLPFAIRAPAALRFALVEYHAGREVGGLLQFLAYKAGFVSRVIHAYSAAAALCLALCSYILIKRSPWRVSRRAPDGAEGVERSRPQTFMPTYSGTLTSILWISALAVTVVHFCAPFPYDDYQVMIFPMVAVALSTALMRLANTRTAILWVLLTAFCLCLVSALSSPMNQKWFVGERDRIWWPLKKESPLANLRRTGRILCSITNPGDVLLTQDTYLAVETGLWLPKGLELGPFSYFPDWNRAKAAACHVLNQEMMLELLETSEAPVAAFSEYGLAIRSPGVTELPSEEQMALYEAVERRYSLFRKVEKFGQAGTRLKIYLRRNSAKRTR